MPNASEVRFQGVSFEQNSVWEGEGSGQFIGVLFAGCEDGFLFFERDVEGEGVFSGAGAPCQEDIAIALSNNGCEGPKAPGHLTGSASISVRDIVLTRPLTEEEEKEQKKKEEEEHKKEEEENTKEDERRARVEEEESYGSENGGEPNRKPCLLGKPVNCATGNETTTETDLTVGGRGPALDSTRTYNSRLAAHQAQPGSFGFGWMGPYSAHLELAERR